MNSTFTFKSFVVDMSSSTATDTTAPSVPASSTSPAWSGSQIAFAILGARDFGAAIVGGLGAKFVLGLSNQEPELFTGRDRADTIALVNALLAFRGIRVQE
jgi:hypothetical protein